MIGWSPHYKTSIVTTLTDIAPLSISAVPTPTQHIFNTLKTKLIAVAVENVRAAQVHAGVIEEGPRTPSGDTGTGYGAGSTDEFNYPSGVAVDHEGHVVVADTYNHRLRKIHVRRPTPITNKKKAQAIHSEQNTPSPLKPPAATPSETQSQSLSYNHEGLEIVVSGKEQLLYGSVYGGCLDVEVPTDRAEWIRREYVHANTSPFVRRVRRVLLLPLFIPDVASSQLLPHLVLDRPLNELRCVAVLRQAQRQQRQQLQLQQQHEYAHLYCYPPPCSLHLP